MQDKTIDNALLALRRQIIRGNGEGLEYVEALLQMKGVPLPAVLAAHRPDRAGKGVMRQMVLTALRERPRSMAEMVDIVASQRPEITREQAYKRVDQALQRLKRSGLARRDDRAWSQR